MSVSGHSQSTSSMVRSVKNPIEYRKQDHIMSTTNTCQMAYAILHSFRGRLCFLINSSAGQTTAQRRRNMSECSNVAAPWRWVLSRENDHSLQVLLYRDHRPVYLRLQMGYYFGIIDDSNSLSILHLTLKQCRSSTKCDSAGLLCFEGIFPELVSQTPTGSFRLF